MDAAQISTVVVTGLAVLGTMGGVTAWFYRRGQQEQSLASSVERHADATEMLAEQVGGLRKTLESHDKMLTEHHWRLKALEDVK